MLSITQLMVRLWVAEEARLGVSRPNGVLQNLWQPLQSHDRGSGRRAKKKKNTRRAGYSRPSSAESPEPTATTGYSDSPPALRSCRADVYDHEIKNKAVQVESNPIGSMAGDVSSTLPVNNGQTIESSGEVSASQESDGPPSAVVLALQVGKRAITTGQGGEGRIGKHGAGASAEAVVAKAMSHLDLRGKIAAVLGMVGFDGGAIDGLGPSDLKASYMAMSYMDFRAGEAWQEVGLISDFLLLFVLFMYFLLLDMLISDGVRKYNVFFNVRNLTVAEDLGIQKS